MTADRSSHLVPIGLLVAYVFLVVGTLWFSADAAQPTPLHTVFDPKHTRFVFSAAGTQTLKDGTVEAPGFFRVTELPNGGNCFVVYNTEKNGDPSANLGQPLQPNFSDTFETNGVPTGSIKAYCDAASKLEVIKAQ